MTLWWKSYIRTAGWRIIWIIWYDDHPSYNSSPRSSHIWFSYINNVISILSRVYNEPIQRPAPTWLVSSIGRALHRYRRGEGFVSLTSLFFFFQAFFWQLQKLRPYPGSMLRSVVIYRLNVFFATFELALQPLMAKHYLLRNMWVWEGQILLTKANM